MYLRENEYVDQTKLIQHIALSCCLNIRNILLKIKNERIHDIQEIRLRISKPLMITTSHGDFMLDNLGEFLKDSYNAYIVTQLDIQQTLEIMSENSLYAYHDELRNGFITLPGGHRVGIVGKAIIEQNNIKTIKEISGLNIRIARQIKGCSDKIIPFIINGNSVYHTLIVSPPNCGKTTILRDIVRVLSDGIVKTNLTGLKIGVVDERSEIAACFKGIPQNDVGLRTDVLDSCPKPQGILMLVRSMSPHIIATDELGTRQDIDAAEEAINAGIKIITTAHAGDISELSKKPIIGQLFKQGLFERIIVLGKSKGMGTVEDIIDGTTFLSLWRNQNVS